MDSEVVAHCVGPLSKVYLSKCPHHIAPCNNLHSHISNQTLSDIFSSSVLNPIPLVPSIPVPLIHPSKLSRTAINGMDPTTVLIREKIRWQMKRDQILKAVQKDKKSIRKKMIENALKEPVGGEAVVPQGVAFLAQHLDLDPDPSFGGVCNWYYTGGTLAKISHKDNHFLLHANHADLSCSRIVEGYQSELSSTLRLEDEEPIFQISTNANGAVVRQKSSVSVLSWENQNDKSLHLKNILNVFDRKHKFVSVALPPGRLKQFSTISNARILKLWDIECTKKYKLKILMQPEEGISLTDNWSILKYLDKRTLLLADRCCLHVLDARARMEEKQLAWCSKQLREMCEEQCNLLCSNLGSHNVYVATTHQLLCLDLRQGFSQRWTHMMASAPHLGFTHNIDDNCEVVCLGSQILSDCVAVVNTWKDGQGQSFYKPTILPSPAQGLHLARQNGECLDPSHTQKCTQSMTGLTFLPAEKGMQVLRQSATGDVFSQDLSMSRKATKKLSEIELMMYSRWSKPTLELPRESELCASVTCTYDFQPLVKEVNLDLEQLGTAPKEDYQFIHSSYQMSKAYMEDCVDLLAGKLLAVWQVDDEDEWAPEIEQRETFVEQNPQEKVINWLQTANISDENTLANIRHPAVSSTPNPFRNNQAKSPNRSENPSEPSPWMTQPSQVLMPTPVPEKQVNTCFPSVMSPPLKMSPPHSMGSSFGYNKKLKTVDDTVVKPKKTNSVTKKPNSVQKKKFIPGF